MKWFRKSLLWMSVVGSSTAAGQEPGPTPVRALTLCRPTPLVAPASTPSPTGSLRIVAETPGPVPAPRPANAPTVVPASNGSPPPGKACEMVRLTSFADAPRGVALGAQESEPNTLALPRDVPALETEAVFPTPVQPSPLRWLFRPAAGLQPVLEPGAVEGPAPTNPDAKAFAAPTPQPPPAAPSSAPAPSVAINPWTGLPMEEGGPVVPGEGIPLDEGDLMAAPQGYGYRFYVRGEYLLWWTRGFYLPPLVATAPSNVPEDVRGAPGAPGTALLFGNGNTPAGMRSGGRFTAGYVLDPCGLWAIEGSVFFLGRQTGQFNADASQFPVISRPFFNVNTGMFDRQLTSTPGLLPTDAFQLRGAIAVHDFSDLWGAEVNVRRLLCSGCNYNVSGLAGFRYLGLGEGVTIQENVVSIAGVQGTNVFNPGNQLTVFDSFRTNNNFYGGQVGLNGEYRRGRWFVGGNAKVALGSTHQSIDVAGMQSVDVLGGGRQTFNGGLLALPSNSGHFTREQVSFVPEVGLKLGYNLTDNVRVFVGYDFLYWTNVVRPGDQIDLALNSNQIPNFNIVPAPASNAVRPVVPFRSTGIWAQGINAGLEFRY